MLVVTTPTLQGKEIKQYLGLVSGEAILGANIFRQSLRVKYVCGNISLSTQPITEYSINMPDGVTLGKDPGTDEQGSYESWRSHSTNLSVSYFKMMVTFD